MLIYAAIYGIENGLELPAPTDINLFTADLDTLGQFIKLPAGKAEAVKY